VLELWDGTRKSDKQFSYSLESVSNQPTRWLVLCWNTFGARTRHWRLRTHKNHHGPDSEEATTFPHIIYSAPLHKGYIQMAFCLETPERESRNCHGWNSRNFGGLYLRAQTSDQDKVWNKVAALVESFPTVCRTPLARTEIGSILDISWQFDSRFFFLP
jgi:hypothetical protein